MVKDRTVMVYIYSHVGSRLCHKCPACYTPSQPSAITNYNLQLLACSATLVIPIVASLGCCTSDG